MIDSKNLKHITKSATLLINEQSRTLESAGKTIYKFGFGQSPFLPPPSVIKVLKKNAARKEYTGVQGILALRQKIAAFHHQVNGLDCAADDILVGTGSKILIFNILACFKKLDVFLPTPSWVSYAPQARLLNHAVFSLQTNFENRWRITPHLLAAAFLRKTDPSVPTILILNFPGNPDGLTYTEGELKAIAETARRLKIIVIADEIYGLLDHHNQHVSLACHYPEGTITTTGLSKWCGAGGWRIGVAIVPPQLGADFKDTLLGLASETYSCAPTPMQYAAIEAYNWNDEIAHYLQQQRAILRGIGQYCYTALTAADVRLHPPEGGFYLFPDFELFKSGLKKRGITTGTEFCAALLAETGVALLPSSAFGLSDQYLAARLAYVDFKDPLSMDRDFDLKRDAARVVGGIDKMVKWLSSIDR